MHVLLGILGVAIIAIILGDAFETIILPRRVARKIRLTRLFYRYSWLAWRAIAATPTLTRKRRDSLFGFYGPLSLILLLGIWAMGMIAGFGLVQYAFGSGLATPGGTPSDFFTNLYFSGTTFTTLGLGDVHPVTHAARIFAVLEGGTGFGFLAIVIGYLPVIYQSFSRRESMIAMLDARAGSPASALELLRRYAQNQALGDVPGLLLEWDRWAAELLESHISYPVLVLYRSQHDNESWLGALATIADVSALVIVGIDGIPKRQATLTFSMARHALVDLSQVVFAPPSPNPDRLPPESFQRLRKELELYGAPLSDHPGAEEALADLRRLYEPYVHGLANYLQLSLPSWFPKENAKDNWQTSAWEKAAHKISPMEFDEVDEHY